MLAALKMLLGISDDTQDKLLEFLIKDTENMVLGFLRLEIMPVQIESLIPVICADIYRAKEYGKAESPENVKSISQGKRSVTIESSRPDDDAILRNYYKRLMPFRNRKGLVPSDVAERA